jgi:hypothetical protein
LIRFLEATVFVGAMFALVFIELQFHPTVIGDKYIAIVGGLDFAAAFLASRLAFIFVLRHVF